MRAPGMELDFHQGGVPSILARAFQSVAGPRVVSTTPSGLISATLMPLISLPSSARWILPLAFRAASAVRLFADHDHALQDELARCVAAAGSRRLRARGRRAGTKRRALAVSG